MGSRSGKPIKIHFLLNGKPLLADKGKDIEQSSIIVQQYGLYEIVNLKQEQSAELELTTNSPDLQLYTFTFGSK